jgi:hypothetical protein
VAPVMAMGGSAPGAAISVIGWRDGESAAL